MKHRIAAGLLAVALLLGLTGCSLPIPLPGKPSAAPAAEAEATPAPLTARKYIVSFDPNGGEVTEGELNQTVRAGTLPQAPQVRRSGYDFAGWDPALTEADSSAAYTAQWTLTTYRPEELFAAIAPAMAEITIFDEDGQPMALGSGFFIDDQGTLVTNYHVIEGACSARAGLYDGTEYDIPEILGYDPVLDIAVLRAKADGNDYLTLSEDPVRTGETIYALGSSEGLTGTFSSGIVSTASRESEGVNYIQITAPISHGNSGGPLVNEHGLVVGINTMTLAEGQNLNFAVDIRELDKVDLSAPQSLADYYDETGRQVYEAAAERSGFFYDEAPYAEVESNDNVLASDPLPNGAWVAGEVAGPDDLDWFFIELEEPATVRFEVAPYYLDDGEYLLGGVVGIGEEDFEVLDILEPTEDLSYSMENACEITFPEPGFYFLTVIAADGYAGSDPLYYQAMATW